MPHPLTADLAETIGTAIMLAAVIALAYALSWPSLADRTPAARRRRMLRNRRIVRFLLGWPPPPETVTWAGWDIAIPERSFVLVRRTVDATNAGTRIVERYVTEEV